MNADRALICAKLSGAAYLDLAAFVSFADAEGLSRVRFFAARPDSEAYITETPTEIFCVFRGTESKADWKTDLDIDLRQSIVGKVHSGFARALENIWYRIEPKILESIRFSQRPVTFTGHSLGGALASIASARFAFHRPGKINLYTFGSPRVGDESFVATFERVVNGESFRFSNNNDAVTTLPPWPYEHLGKKIYIDSSGRVRLRTGTWHRFKDRALGRLKDFGKPGTDGIKDHAIENYIDALERHVKAATAS